MFKPNLSFDDSQLISVGSITNQIKSNVPNKSPLFLKKLSYSLDLSNHLLDVNSEKYNNLKSNSELVVSRD